MRKSNRPRSVRTLSSARRVAPLTSLAPGDRLYPPGIAAAFRGSVPPSLSACGSAGLLLTRKLGILCSNRCPGPSVIEAYDLAGRIPRTGLTVVGGFHSPVERQCLEVLVVRLVPVIHCLARPINSLRIPKAWRGPIAAGRLLLLSPFFQGSRRVTRDRAFLRNRLVAALADTILVPYLRPGGNLERLLAELGLGERDIVQPDDPAFGVLLRSAPPDPPPSEGLFRREEQEYRG